MSDGGVDFNTWRKLQYKKYNVQSETKRQDILQHTTLYKFGERGQWFYTVDKDTPKSLQKVLVSKAAVDTVLRKMWASGQSDSLVLTYLFAKAGAATPMQTIPFIDSTGKPVPQPQVPRSASNQLVFSPVVEVLPPRPMLNFVPVNEERIADDIRVRKQVAKETAEVAAQQLAAQQLAQQRFIAQFADPGYAIDLRSQMFIKSDGTQLFLVAPGDEIAYFDDKFQRLYDDDLKVDGGSLGALNGAWQAGIGAGVDIQYAYVKGSIYDDDVKAVGGANATGLLPSEFGYTIDDATNLNEAQVNAIFQYRHNANGYVPGQDAALDLYYEAFEEVIKLAWQKIDANVPAMKTFDKTAINKQQAALIARNYLWSIWNDALEGEIYNIIEQLVIQHSNDGDGIATDPQYAILFYRVVETGGFKYCDGVDELDTANNDNAALTYLMLGFMRFLARIDPNDLANETVAAVASEAAYAAARQAIIQAAQQAAIAARDGPRNAYIAGLVDPDFSNGANVFFCGNDGRKAATPATPLLQLAHFQQKFADVFTNDIWANGNFTNAVRAAGIFHSAGAVPAPGDSAFVGSIYEARLANNAANNQQKTAATVNYLHGVTDPGANADPFIEAYRDCFNTIVANKIAEIQAAEGFDISGAGSPLDTKGKLNFFIRKYVLTKWNVVEEAYVKGVVVDRFIANPGTLATDPTYKLQYNLINWISQTYRFKNVGAKYIATLNAATDAIAPTLFMLHFMRYLVAFNALGGGSRAKRGGANIAEGENDWSTIITTFVGDAARAVVNFLIVVFLIIVLWKFAKWAWALVRHPDFPYVEENRRAREVWDWNAAHQNLQHPSQATPPTPVDAAGTDGPPTINIRDDINPADVNIADIVEVFAQLDGRGAI